MELEKALEALDGDEKEELSKWLSMKSEKTIEAFLKLDDEGKEAILEFLEEFADFEEIECKGKKFVLTHAGIDNFEADKDLEDYSEEDFVFAKTDYQVIMSVGNLVSTRDFGELPENISVYSHVDQIAVLKKTDVFWPCW